MNDGQIICDDTTTRNRAMDGCSLAGELLPPVTNDYIYGWMSEPSA